MCTEETEIENASKIKIDLIMDTKELESVEKEDRSMVIDNAFVASFSK